MTVARTPTKNTTQWTRIMAHDRSAKPAYVKCYRPNFRLTDEGVVFDRRSGPLTTDQIRTCETKFLPKEPSAEAR